MCISKEECYSCTNDPEEPVPPSEVSGVRGWVHPSGVNPWAVWFKGELPAAPQGPRSRSLVPICPHPCL